MKARRATTAAGLLAFLTELHRRHGVPHTDPRTGVVTLTGPHPVPRDLPPLIAANGTPDHSAPAPHAGR